MRDIMNISLPAPLAKQVRQAVKKGNFASISEFFRHLIRWWNTEMLARELKAQQKAFDRGEGIELKSLRNLMD